MRRWRSKVTAIVVAVVMLASMVGFATPAMAVKPTLNLAAAQVVPWNLSGAVMPVPPYGSMDIPGSDTASKLIVNQPNGNTEVAITGAMSGLVPLSTYTVYLSKGYTPATESGWNVTGSYTIDLTVGTTPYVEYVVLTQSGSSITGTYLAMNAAGTQNRWNIDSGAVTGNQLSFVAHYESSTLTADFSAEIAPDGALVNGIWHDRPGYWRYAGGLWSSTAGHAAKTYSGSTGWPGLFTANVQPFTFVTDEFGAGSWHVNLKDADFAGEGTYPLSIWVNGGSRTVLISDTFTVVK